MKYLQKLKRELQALLDRHDEIREIAANKPSKYTSDLGSESRGIPARTKVLKNQIEEEEARLDLPISKPIVHPGESIGDTGDETSGMRLYKHGEKLPSRTIDEDHSPLDMGRFIRGIVTGDWRQAEDERRSLNVATDALGGYLVPDPLSSKIIDLARNKSVVSKAGALVLPMETSTLKLAKITQDATGYWRAENAAITESDMGFGSMTLSCKVLAALCRVSIELIEDAPNTGQLIENSIASALALEMDRVGLFGSGSGSEPIGVYNTPGISEISMGADGAALTSYDPFSNAATTLLTSNADPKVCVYAPRTAGVIDLLKDTTNQPLQAPQSFKNMTKLVSNQIPTDLIQGVSSNASCSIIGDFSNMVIGMRKSVTIEASRAADADSFSKMQVLIRGYIRADIGIMRADHFCKITGIIPA